MRRGRRDRSTLAALGAGFLLLAAFYFWTAAPLAGDWRIHGEQPDYLNLLGRAFLHGHLYVPVQPSPAILKSPDPYNPALRAPGSWLYDASYYRHRYYLYFGPAPTLTLLLPFRLLTGSELPEGLAMAAFACLGLFASLAVWEGVRRRYFPEAGPGMAVAAVALLGLPNYVPALLRRVILYHLPIVAGYGFVMAALLALHQTLHARRWREAWYAAAGTLLGLAVASRPIYAVAAPAILFPLFWHWREGVCGGAGGRWPGPSWWRLAACALVPLAVIAAGLAEYNHARFGSWTEFGLKYQLTGMHEEAKMRHFSWSYLRFDFASYFLAAPRLLATYPYFSFPSGSGVPVPAGYGEAGLTCGILAGAPICWVAVASWFAGWRRSPAERGPLLVWLGALWYTFVATTLVLVLYYAAILRYTVDFAPLLMLCAAVGLLVLDREIRRWPRWLALLGRAAWITALGFSAALGVSMSLEVYGLLERDAPELHAEIARFFNAPAAWRLPRCSGPADGPVEMNLVLGALKPGRVEPLLAVDSPDGREHVLLEYPDAGDVAFDYVSGDNPPVRSAWLPAAPGSRHRIYLDLGSLYPAGAGAKLERARRRWAIGFDGETVLAGAYGRTMAGDGKPTFGFDPDTDRFAPTLSARIVGLARPALAEAERRIGDRTRVAFEFRLPLEASAGLAPLLVAAGRSGGFQLQARWTAGGAAEMALVAAGGRQLARAPLPPIRSGGWHAVCVAQRFVPAPGPLAVSCDGRQLFESVVPGADLSATPADVGWDPQHRRVFPGLVRNVLSTSPFQPLLPTGCRALTLILRFPRDRQGASEPLLVTGRTGQADFYIVQYLDADHVQIGLDHWGVGLRLGPAVPLDYGQAHRVRFLLPGFVPGAAGPGQGGSGRLQIDLDRRIALEMDAPYYGFSPDEVAIGRNDIGGSTCDQAFTGTVLARAVEWGR